MVAPGWLQDIGAGARILGHRNTTWRLYTATFSAESHSQSTYRMACTHVNSHRISLFQEETTRSNTPITQILSSGIRTSISGKVSGGKRILALLQPIMHHVQDVDAIEYQPLESSLFDSRKKPSQICLAGPILSSAQSSAFTLPLCGA